MSEGYNLTTEAWKELLDAVREMAMVELGPYKICLDDYDIMGGESSGHVAVIMKDHVFEGLMQRKGVPRPVLGYQGKPMFLVNNESLTASVLDPNNLLVEEKKIGPNRSHRKNNKRRYKGSGRG